MPDVRHQGPGRATRETVCADARKSRLRGGSRTFWRVLFEAGRRKHENTKHAAQEAWHASMDRFGIFCFHCHVRLGDQLHITLDMIGSEGSGVLVYLPQEGRGIGLVEKIRA